MNNKMRSVMIVILVMIVYIILNNTIVNILANVESFLRHDNAAELIETVYKQKIEVLEEELAMYEQAQENLKIYENESYILAKSALRNIYDIYDYLIVNTSSKVSEDDVALNEDGLVGFVKESTKTTAKITLLTHSPSLSIKVGENYGILGNYDPLKGVFKLNNIDNYKTVKVGDAVTTSGFQSVPKDLRVGKVISVENKGVEKIIEVKPYVDFKNLNYLFIASK